jgi:hypothetical protein
VAAGLPDNPQPAIGADIVNAPDFRAVLAIYHRVLAVTAAGTEPSHAALPVICFVMKITFSREGQLWGSCCPGARLPAGARGSILVKISMTSMAG